jgi:hypothetical protein
MASAVTSTDATDRQRPFKVFVSLLDKWEIGSLLTEAMVLDVFTPLRQLLSTRDLQDELHMTANMLFESLDPYLTWKSLFKAVVEDLQSEEAAETASLLSIPVFEAEGLARTWI